MTNEELLSLEALHEEAEQTATAFHAIAIRADPSSETAKQFKKMVDNAFTQAETYYKASLEAYRKSEWSRKQD
jgi:hypothetical protein